MLSALFTKSNHVNMATTSLCTCENLTTPVAETPWIMQPSVVLVLYFEYLESMRVP